MQRIRSILYLFCVIAVPYLLQAQEMVKMDKVASGKAPVHPDIRWFREAKFGMFMHWGLYSMLEGKWKDKDYYGSGEWLMERAKIPAAEYAAAASRFNPDHFNAEEWAKFAKDAGVRYLVITAKHHEGFSMYDSKVSDYNIVKASPYKKDPMKALSDAVRRQGMQFGFYYSQYLDWHEPNGGGNDWDFDESKKDYQQYYRDKSVPQLKELLSNYGPLGIVWFDMPGGLTKEQTSSMIDSLRLLQPNTLFSSRVGQGLGDYIDFGDSETPPSPIEDAWEAIYTHNDSWGYIAHDLNFKSPEEVIRLLATVASKGGNLMINVGPDGTGRIPQYSLNYLRETGKWLKRFGESIYGTGYGSVPRQPWGVTTSKPGKLFLHVFTRPLDGRLLVPGMNQTILNVYQVDNKKPVHWYKQNGDLYLDLPLLTDKRNTVFAVAVKGPLQKPDVNAPIIVSSQYQSNSLDAIAGHVSGNATVSTLTYSHYFGDWKHASCVNGMKDPGDSVAFSVRITDAGDYKIILEYSCPPENSKQEGVVQVDNREYQFETLGTSVYAEDKPLLFIKHAVAVTTMPHPGIYTIKIHPSHEGKELFHLKTVLLEPVH